MYASSLRAVPSTWAVKHRPGSYGIRPKSSVVASMIVSKPAHAAATPPTAARCRIAASRSFSDSLESIAIAVASNAALAFVGSSAMLSSPHERPERRRRAGRAATRRDLETALADASQIACPGRRVGPARDGEASARSPAQATQASLAAAARPTRCGPFVRAHRNGFALRGFWINGFASCRHDGAPPERASRLDRSSPANYVEGVRVERPATARLKLRDLNGSRFAASTRSSFVLLLVR